MLRRTNVGNCDVAIVGAGPYGLSIASHLRAAKVDFRIFGAPMEFWLKHMPKGMHLKSEGFASSMYDPGSAFTLKAFCAERSIPYADIGTPVPIEVFTSYGVEFQKLFVPDLENQKVVNLEHISPGFRVTLESGEVFVARRVVVAVGLTYYPQMPQELAALPRALATHSSEHGPIDQFKGRKVLIMGSGASALDLAALLYEGGASAEVIARSAVIRFHDPPETSKPSRLDRLRAPVTGIGIGWPLWMCANLPLVFRRMPEGFRIDRVRRILGPAPCWFIKDRVVGKVGISVGTTVKSAGEKHGRVMVELVDNVGGHRTVDADHIIAATGYRYDVRRIGILDQKIISKLQLVGDSPSLSSNFESTVPGLYFVGITAANTFGPLLRFAFGAGFAAPRISTHLASTSRRYHAVRAPKQNIRADRETVDSVAD